LRSILTCGGSAGGNYSGAYSDVDGPRCGATFQYQDGIFVFSPSVSQTVTASYTSSPEQNDGAIFVLEGSCHTGLCAASSLDVGDRHSVTFDAVAGVTYYLVLELPSFQPTYTIQLS